MTTLLACSGSVGSTNASSDPKSAYEVTIVGADTTSATITASTHMTLTVE